MAITHKKSAQFIKELFSGEHDLTTAVVKIILLNDTFVFDPDTHSIYTDISASELATANGYTQLTKLIEGISIAIVDGQVIISCSPVSVAWTATGGSIPATGAAALINDSHVNKTIISCIEFGANYITVDGTMFQINFANGVLEGTPNPA